MAKLVNLCLVIMVVGCSGHLLPEDTMSDDAEQLIREKRNNFLDDILKTIPFFQPSPVERNSDYNADGTLKDPNDNEEDDEDDVNLFSQSETDTNQPPISTTVSTLNIHSATFSHTATFVPNVTKLPSITATPSIVQSETLTNYFHTSISSVGGSVFSNLQFFSFSPMNRTVFYNKSTVVNTFVSTQPISAALHTPFLLTSKPSTRMSRSTAGSTPLLQGTLSSIKTTSLSTIAAQSTAPNIALANVSFKAISTSLASSLASSASHSASNVDNGEPLIKMMLLEAPKLPNEIGFGDTLAVQHFAKDSSVDRKEVKGIHYFYSNVLIPVMSGLLGALTIAFAILLYKCVRRRNLQKVKYYGGKPNATDFYRLDHMSLLSDSDSDVE